MLTVEEYDKHMRRICMTHPDGCKDCFMYNTVTDGCFWDNLHAIFSMFDRVEEWVEKHPAQTNRDKFEEVFGVKLKRQELTRKPLCEQYKLNPIDCLKKTGSICSYCQWWDDEYAEQKGEE